MPNLPSGTATFLFSDIEGSTALLKALEDQAHATLGELRDSGALTEEQYVRAVDKVVGTR